MSAVPPNLPFGELDRILLRSPGPVEGSVILLSTEWVALKDNKKACQVTDGGSKHQTDADSGVAYSCRMVVRAEAAAVTDLTAGCIIKFSGLKIICIKTGEKILDAQQAENVAWWDFSDFFSECHPHPDTNNKAPPRQTRPGVRPSHIPLAAVNSPEQQWEPESPSPPPKFQAPQIEAYQPQRGRSGVSTQHRSVPAEPYKPVQRKTDVAYLKIMDLTSYVDRWTIKARVTQKQPVKTYTNARGDGRLFSVVLVDAHRGEIKATFFNDGVDVFWDVLQPNHVYSFSRGSIKACNPKFNTTRHQYEISFGADADIKEIADDVAEIPSQVFEFEPMSKVNSGSVHDLMDVCAVATRVLETGSVSSKRTGQPLERRNVTLMDQTGTAAELTLWDTKCSLFDSPPEFTESVENGIWFVAAAKLRIEEYNGRRLATTMGTVLETYLYDTVSQRYAPTPALSAAGTPPPAVDELRKWYLKEGHNIRPQLMVATGPRKDEKRATIAEIVDAAQHPDNVELSRDGLWFSCVASVSDSGVTPGKRWCYTACPQCNKKVATNDTTEALADPFGAGYSSGPGETFNSFYCSSCSKKISGVLHKYIFQFEIQDHTNSLRLQVLGDAGNGLLGVAADEIEKAKLTGQGPNGEDWIDYFNRIRRKAFVFRILCRSETYHDETKLRYKMIACEPLQNVAARECQTLLQRIEARLRGIAQPDLS
eukprot:Gregarina_sp_Poly_1__5245@NODE_277_length_10206_cov_85_389782_g241_i0_p3_GENE_NODE_277_length_10206_cov_85_389782_g241_i0NODE_277_length_10206_cov_85_389782_g241_i0_p3_ORF_typecomplete_len708_score93_02Rep_facA_C/PF08646_10/1_7e03Rep_facA_C/PF08646_10/4_7e03Rep_facA_C/PF08646_10/8_4e25REPA_OB_2/PF16900_5/2_7REPA_OB_2/PF16900_5/3_6e15DUF223/PF02721_14/8e11DUF223/PF02721_14/4_3e03DUF223/PF02721_14/7e03tRNA_anticodon/PF01336_25/1_2e04tRNA_anticodon/PF01336_25/0_00013tRNA_anticodon/PF01336_25/3_7e02